MRKNYTTREGNCCYLGKNRKENLVNKNNNKTGERISLILLITICKTKIFCKTKIRTETETETETGTGTGTGTE